MQTMKVKSSHRDQKDIKRFLKRIRNQLGCLLMWIKKIVFHLNVWLDIASINCLTKLFSGMTTHVYYHSATEMLIHHQKKKILRIVTDFICCITIAKAPEIRNYFCQVKIELFHIQMKTQPIHSIFCWLAHGLYGYRVQFVCHQKWINSNKFVIVIIFSPSLFLFWWKDFHQLQQTLSNNFSLCFHFDGRSLWVSCRVIENRL